VAKGDITRVSFGPGLWLTFLASTLVIYAATAWTPKKWQISLISYLPFIGVALLLLTGSLSALSLLREYANNSADFIAQLQRHLLYTVGATAGGIIIGIPLGLIAAGSKRAESAIFGTLNVLNVLPVLAFIGLLNPVLTWLSNSIPAVAALQISGVGWMPIIIVLTVYATYPIVRNTYTAMLTLDPSAIDAANGIGMGRARLLFEVKLPLGMPVIIAGIRIALVQTTAGAIIAGLVGGGGLGTFVFLGASQTAMDLVLLGTIPIVFLGLFFDRFALGVQNLFNRWSTARD
jgi:osmoprotectant transport system permease protein